MKARIYFIPLLLAVVLTGLGSGCTTTDFVTGKRTRNLYTIEEEIELGRQVVQQMMGELEKQKLPVNQDPAGVALVREITGNIVAVADIKNVSVWFPGKVERMPNYPEKSFDYRASFVGDPKMVNAYALPGGNIMVFEGIWHPKDGLVRTVDELAAVIGHEIAHVNCRHSTEAMTRQIGPNILLGIGMVWATLAEKDDLQLLFGGLMLAYNGLVVTKYSRKDELEADRVGMMYMAQAGYHPEAAVRVWERLAKARESQIAKPLSIFATHPRDTKRAQELRKHLPRAMELYEAAPVKREGSRPLVGVGGVMGGK
ncbi:MAG: M48 family metallopeptidase [Lentisphaerae bacterium]|jgi:predicted Zn-dependent protease|nr:M48 family metallopeptidase [Lentisphaerota bacterium]